MDKSHLARELRRYIFAQTDREPDVPAPVEAEDFTEGDQEMETETEPETEPEPEPGRQQQLDELAGEWAGCEKCRLSENRNTVVFGQGDAGARVMVVGEGPGAEEDEQGLPFVGRSGKLLRQGFEKVGLSESDLFITNVVKCRPPDNRDPRQDELSACRPCLDRQFELIEPGAILSLGNFAMDYFLGRDQGIMSARGEVYDYDDIPLVPTFHPSHLLYHPDEEKTKQFLGDLKLAASQLDD